VRLFVAVELPEAIRREVAGRASRVARTLPPAKWLRAEALHVTLAFLGEVDGASAAPLASALAEAVAPLAPFPARIAGAGAFPPRGGARVLWLGLEPPAPLVALAGAVRGAIAGCGLPFDEKPFRAHLTVARCRAPFREREREAAVRALAAGEALELRVERVGLIESRLGSAGADYTTLAEAPLGAAA